MRTLPAAPSAAPSSIQPSPYDSSSLQLTWTVPDRKDWNANEIGYRIAYREYPSNDTWSVAEIPSGSEHSDREQVCFKKKKGLTWDFNEMIPSSMMCLWAISVCSSKTGQFPSLHRQNESLQFRRRRTFLAACFCLHWILDSEEVSIYFYTIFPIIFCKTMKHLFNYILKLSKHI